MPMTKEELEATNRLAKSQEDLAAALKAGGNGNRIEQMLNQQQPPGVTNSLGTENKAFSLHRFLSSMSPTGGRDPSKFAPHEWDICDKYTKAINTTGCCAFDRGGVWLPMDLNETWDGRLTSQDEHAKNFSYIKSVMTASRSTFDPEEYQWRLKRQMLARAGFVGNDGATVMPMVNVKASASPVGGISAYEDLYGGSVVAPPVQGEIIPFIRPNAAFLAAGAQSMTLPPNGRWVAPRITGVPNVRAIGEGQTTDITDLTTGNMELTAKKLAGAVLLTEEATAFTSGTLDAIAQAELGRSLGLKVDAYAFYGTGGTQIPAGITNNTYQNANQLIGITQMETHYPNIRGIGADGNTLLPEYGDIFPAIIEDKSFDQAATAGAWVMRPLVYATAVARRADAVAQGDQAGPMVDILRRFGDGAPSSWRGRRVVRSTNIANNYTKGSSGAVLSDVFFGLWQYAIMATYGAINFLQGHTGTTFLNGQYVLRATMFADVGFRYPPAFLWYPNVIPLTNNF